MTFCAAEKKQKAHQPLKILRSIRPKKTKRTTTSEMKSVYLHTHWYQRYRICRCISHTPLRRFFPSSIARQPRGCQYRTTRLRKALGETLFPTPTLLAPTLFQHSKCGDIDHGKSAQGGLVLYTPSYTVLS